jgi:transposase InsO family protein
VSLGKCHSCLLYGIEFGFAPNSATPVIVILGLQEASVKAGVQPSMGSVGDAYDNAMCESFFATLECELIDRVRLRTREEAELAVFEFIEGWYNPHRRHSSLDYECPIGYEEKHWGVAPAASPDLTTETG